MKIAVFKYKASTRILGKDGECLNAELIESEINEFCEDKEVVDIKVNTFEHYRYSEGSNEVKIVYTIMYK